MDMIFVLWMIFGAIIGMFFHYNYLPDEWNEINWVSTSLISILFGPIFWFIIILV